MRATLDEVPREVKVIGQRLTEGLAPDSVYLFGSYARGEAGPDSDLDFLVVVPDSQSSRYERAVEAHRLVSDVTMPKEIVVVTRAEWEKQLKAPSSLCSTVAREGIVVAE